ncbi:RadC family protein [Polycyclovorans algicola]|uniref:RadC family protein n=1 Tax=Polycyclovorans algicola TaxID=616992 RepID=UPI0004A72B6A|nr:DNA repair protein RadC [Polycyclovorans algicola]
MAITDWPADERPRERLLAHGAGALSDAELLAIFLRTGVTGLTAVDLSRHLLQRFGGLRALLTADRGSFCAEKGLGDAKYAQLQAVLEMSRRHLAERLKVGTAIDSPEAIAEYLQAQLRDAEHEIFALVMLDSRHRVLAFEPISHGTINAATVHPREVVKRVLKHNAAAVILAHNHPSGVAEPSPSDRQLTARLSDALKLIDVRVLDHLVIGDGPPYSFARAGLL